MTGICVYEMEPVVRGRAGPDPQFQPQVQQAPDVWNCALGTDPFEQTACLKNMII